MCFRYVCCVIFRLNVSVVRCLVVGCVLLLIRMVNVCVMWV